MVAAAMAVAAMVAATGGIKISLANAKTFQDKLLDGSSLFSSAFVVSGRDNAPHSLVLTF